MEHKKGQLDVYEDDCSKRNRKIPAPENPNILKINDLQKIGVEYLEAQKLTWQCPNSRCKTINTAFIQMIICKRCGVHVMAQKITDHFHIFVPYLWCPHCELFTPSVDFCGKCSTKCFPNPEAAERIIEALQAQESL